MGGTDQGGCEPAAAAGRRQRSSACHARINPATAYLLLTEYVTLPAGAWVIQNSANSGVGRALIAIAKSLGLKTVTWCGVRMWWPNSRRSAAMWLLSTDRTSPSGSRPRPEAHPLRLPSMASPTPRR